MSIQNGCKDIEPLRGTQWYWAWQWGLTHRFAELVQGKFSTGDHGFLNEIYECNDRFNANNLKLEFIMEILSTNP